MLLGTQCLHHQKMYTGCVAGSISPCVHLALSQCLPVVSTIIQAVPNAFCVKFCKISSDVQQESASRVIALRSSDLLKLLLPALVLL